MVWLELRSGGYLSTKRSRVSWLKIKVWISRIVLNMPSVVSTSGKLWVDGITYLFIHHQDKFGPFTILGMDVLRHIGDLELLRG